MTRIRIEQARCFRYGLPLRTPLPLRDRFISVRTGWLLRLTGSGGGIGWGDIAPLAGFSREGPDQVERELRTLCRRLPGTSSSWNQVLEASFRPGGCAGSPSVAFGLESASADLAANVSGVGLVGLLGGEPVDSVPVNALLPGTAAPEQVEQWVAEGYSTIKVKVGRGPVGQEIAWLKELSGRLAGRARLRLDANRAWSLDEATRFAADVPRERLDYVEEPLSDPRRLCEWARSTGLPWAADESLAERIRTAHATSGPRSPAQWESRDPSRPLHAEIEELLRLPGLRAVILKPTLLGGVSWCLAIGRRARTLGVQPILSAAFESGVGIRMLATLAAALAPETPCGLDPYRWLAEDVLSRPLRIEQGRCRLSSVEAPGMVEECRLQDVTDGDDTMPPQGSWTDIC